VIEVVMFTFYAEYLPIVNANQSRKDQEASQELLKYFPDLQRKFDFEFKEQKRNKQFTKISQITSTNIQETV
jgi:hypothetical protein